MFYPTNEIQERIVLGVSLFVVRTRILSQPERLDEVQHLALTLLRQSLESFYNFFGCVTHGVKNGVPRKVAPKTPVGCGP